MLICFVRLDGGDVMQAVILKIVQVAKQSLFILTEILSSYISSIAAFESRSSFFIIFYLFREITRYFIRVVIGTFLST